MAEMRTRGPGALADWEDRWVTDMGKWFPGERVVLRGKDLLSELSGEPWMRVLMYGITGRVFDDRQVRLFEGIWVIATSYPDPRIWPNRVAALAGTSRGTVGLGMGGAMASSEALLYGGRTNIRMIDLYYKLRHSLERGEALDDLIKHEFKVNRGVPGFGRPIHSSDERIAPMMSLASDTGFGDGYFVNLAFAIQDSIQRLRYRFKLNITGLTAALAADQGLSPTEYSRYVLACFYAGMMFAYCDAADKPEGSFFPIRCEKIECEVDHPRRGW